MRQDKQRGNARRSRANGRARGRVVASSKRQVVEGERLRLGSVHPVLGCVGNLERLLLSLAGRGGRAASCLHAVHRVDTSRRHFGVVNEVEPCNGALTLGALASCLGGVHRTVLRHHSKRVGGELGLVEGESGNLLREEMVAQPIAVTLGLQVHIELPGAKRAEGERETRDGGDLPLRKRVPVQSRSDVVELG